MSEQAAVSRRRRISAVWIVPLLAVGLGAWMIWFTLQNQGPEITILFGTANEGIWVLNELYRTTFVNRQMAAMLGCTMSELVDRPVEDFLKITCPHWLRGLKMF